MFTKLEKFLAQAVGCSYGLSAAKLTRSETIKKKKDGLVEIDEERTFFCSELVAKAYKILGIIEDDNVSCTQYMPGSFSQKGDKVLKLCPDVSIEHEKLVIMEREDLNSEFNEALPDE